MNFVESLKHVVKTKGQGLLSSFVKEDVKTIIKEVVTDVVSLTKKSKVSVKAFSLKNSVSDIKNNVYDVALLIKVIPQRINDGFRIFSQQMIDEMDKLPDPKQKTMFCMKVLAGLSKFPLSSAYSLGMGQHSKFLAFGRGKKAYSNLVMSRMLYRSIQVFIIKFLEEVEKEMKDPVELENIRSFKNIVLDDTGNAVDKFFEGIVDPEDRAFAIVENFKNYIFTGES